MLAFFRISWSKWIGHVNRMDSKRNQVKYLTIILRKVG